MKGPGRPERPPAEPMAHSDPRVLDRLRRVLFAARNADGGWGYYRGKLSRLEPTCWATLALTTTELDGQAWDPRAALGLLALWQRADGLLTEDKMAPPNLAFNALASLVLLHMERRGGARPSSTVPDRPGLVTGLQRIAGVAVASSPAIRQDSRLRGWPWIDGTFSWVEPTSWCVLSLKKARLVAGDSIDRGRIEEAERMLVDRCCEGGGWNYGNASVFGSNLHPYVPTTAEALIALQDRAMHPVVTRSLAWLCSHCQDEPSGPALALSVLCLRAYDREAPDKIETRLAGQAEATLDFGNMASIAMTAVGLSASVHGIEPFSLTRLAA